MEISDNNFELIDLLAEFLNVKAENDPGVLEFTEILEKCPSDYGIPFTFLKEIFKNLVSVTTLNQFKSKILKEIQTTIDHNALLFHGKISDIEEKCLGLEHRIEVAKKKFGNDYEVQSRKFGEIQSFLSNKPWMKEISPLTEEINAKPNFEDIYVVKVGIEPKLEGLEGITKMLQKNIKDFEAALARMDEILLTKSSKEDIHYLNTHLDSYVSYSHLDKILPELEGRVFSLEQLERRRKNSFSDPQEGCSKVSHRNTSKDFTILFNKVSNISSMIESKIDKVEILPLLESIELKDIAFKRAFDSLLFDFQQFAVLQQESLKTMIRSLDSAEKKNKQRNDLLKASEKLLANISLKISENKNQISSKSASFNRNSQSPEIPERIIATNLSRNSNRTSKRQVYNSKSNRMSINN